jgi:hypothetical protein
MVMKVLVPPWSTKSSGTGAAGGEVPDLPGGREDAVARAGADAGPVVQDAVHGSGRDASLLSDIGDGRAHGWAIMMDFDVVNRQLGTA